ncbi:MAG: hypothetical protein IJV31_04695 [Clostridia bacterium]|nr:hypothetical protein [Clostridia bacterium]
MKVKNYRHIHTGEIVADEDAEIYALEKLGVTVTAEDGILTLEQREFINATKDWYFSGDWIAELEEVS